MPRTYSTNIPQVVLGHAYELWSLTANSPSGLLVWCPTGAQAIQIRKKLYAVRTKERNKSTTKDQWGTTTPGRTAWDNLSIYMCYDPNEEAFISLNAKFPNTIDFPKALRNALPRFLWIGSAAMIFEGVQIFHPTSGELLKNFDNFPKIPPRVLDNIHAKE